VLLSRVIPRNEQLSTVTFDPPGKTVITPPTAEEEVILRNSQVKNVKEYEYTYVSDE
jgi:hypothetical protein